jgi:hypothetical protein
MSEIATRPSGAVTSLAQPRMTAWLRDALRDRLMPHPDAGVAPLRPGLREEAARAVAAYETALRPASVAEWAGWLGPFRATAANPPPDRDAFARSAAALASALPEVPASALTAEAQRAIMRTSRFWPGPADVWPVVHPLFAPRQAELLALRRIAAEQAPPAREEVAPEVRAAMAERARALAGEIRAAAIEREGGDKMRLRPAPISDGAMLAHLDRLAEGGNEIAAFRAARLREKLGASS